MGFPPKSAPKKSYTVDDFINIDETKSIEIDEDQSKISGKQQTMK